MLTNKYRLQLKIPIAPFNACSNFIDTQTHIFTKKKPYENSYNNQSK